MAYTTQTQVEQAIGKDNVRMLTDDMPRTGSVNVANLNAAIAEAERTVNAKLGGVFIVPWVEPSVPAIIQDVATHLTVYNLYARRYDLDMPNAVKQRRDAALAMLNDLRDGSAVLDADKLAVSSSGLTLTNKTPSDKLFPRDVLDQMP